MAGTENQEKPILKLKLLVDKKKNKVVLAESGKEFVDVLFSLLTLPMGTIVRLLKKYQHDQNSQVTTLGCLNNIYNSVFDLGMDNFLSEVCREMLLYPRSVNENQCRKLRLNIDDTVLKCYRCLSCSRTLLYSNFCSARCSCGALMDKEIEDYRTFGYGEIFVSNKYLFTITEKMEVGFTSMGLTLKILKSLGYTNANQLQEMLVDVDHDKVLALLQCLFSSVTPLTDVFLMKKRSCVISNPFLPLQEGDAGTAKSNVGIHVTVFTSKVDQKVLYVESGKEFVDLLFTFLALPLKYAWEIPGSNIEVGCIGNLCETFKSFNSSKGSIPWYYSLPRLLDVCYGSCDSELQVFINSQYYAFKQMDPRCRRTYESSESCGFVKREKMFMVSDDLTITPMDLSSNICSLKMWNMDLDDIEEQVIIISKTEAIRLLRASFLTSTALNTAFGSLLTKKPKDEKP